jgi:hypothetical protein
MIIGSAAIVLVVAWAAAAPIFEARPVYGRADNFIRPFDYVIPAGSNVVLDSKSDHLQVFVSPQTMLGLSIWAVDDVLVDPCPPLKIDARGTVRSRQPGVDGLLDYLQSVDGLHVSPMGYMTIDQREAVRVNLTAGGERTCPALPDGPSSWLFPWRDTSPTGDGTGMGVPRDRWVPLAILDVDGQTIVFELWSGENWVPTGESLVNSIRFAYRPPPLTPSPTRSH